MILKENERLERYTTMRIGGYTPRMYIPESEAELIKTISHFNTRQEKYYLLGNGSNVLITDKILSRPVILNTKSCDYINFQANGMVEVGASVDLRKLIKQLAENNLTSPVALYTIPATLGGAIFQNASRNSFKVSIGDNLVSVRYFDGEKIGIINQQDCQFRWRYSLFRDRPNWTILSAVFQFEPQSKAVTQAKLRESLNAAANKSYRQYSSAGSVFKTKSQPIMQYFQGWRLGNAEFSDTTLNTIHNLGGAKFRDVMGLIWLTKLAHWLRLKKVELEIDIWQ